MDKLLTRAQQRMAQLTSRVRREPKPVHDARVSHAGEDDSGALMSPTASSSSRFATAHFGSIRDVLAMPVVDVDALRRHCWFGCPNDSRFAAWALLLDYWPATAATRERVLQRRRAEYHDCVARHYTPHDWSAVLEAASSVSFARNADAAVGTEEVSTIRQVRKDVPRTANGVAVVTNARVQHLLERLLFTWAVRHPASGYVQGMNDLTLPFLYTALADRLSDDDRGDVAKLLRLDRAAAEALLARLEGDGQLGEVEADTYALTSTFISAVQDNFTYDQTGAHAMVAKLEQVLHTTDPALTMHLADLGIRFPEFAFRWMNCFLLRELNALQGIRLWDTYLCDLNDFAETHIYVCAALLRLWADTITRSAEFVSVMHFLQNLPTKEIDERGMGELCSSAFLLQQLYKPTLGGLSQPDGLGARGSVDLPS